MSIDQACYCFRHFSFAGTDKADIFGKVGRELRVVPAILNQIVETDFGFALADIVNRSFRHAGFINDLGNRFARDSCG